MYRSMMLQPAPMSTSQSNLWTCAMWYVVNHSGLMCLSSCLLRLFTCTVFTWWNVAPYNSLCVVGCVVPCMAVAAMFLLLPVPSDYGLSLASAFFLHLLFCPFPYILSPSHTCNTWYLWWGTPFPVVKVLLHKSSRTCKYPDFCLP